MHRHVLAATAAVVLLGGITLATPSSPADATTPSCKPSVTYGKVAATTASTNTVKRAKKVVYKRHAHRYRVTFWVTVRGASTGRQSITVTSCDAQSVPHTTRYPAAVKATVNKRVKVTVVKPRRAAAVRLARAKATKRARVLARPAAHAKALRLVTSSKKALTAKAKARHSYVVGQEGLAEHDFVTALNAKRKAAGLGAVTWSTELDALTAPDARALALTGLLPHPDPSDLPSAPKCEEALGIGPVGMLGYTSALSGPTATNANAAASGALGALLSNAQTKAALLGPDSTRIAVGVWTRPDASGNQTGALLVDMFAGTCPEMR